MSVAEAMGNLYGNEVRIITAIAGFVGTAGIIAVQLKVSGELFVYCFNVPEVYGIIIGGMIVTLYSSLGGIKSVTFTDVIQFFTFGTIVPIIGFFIVNSLDNLDNVMNTLHTNSLFDPVKVFDFSDPKAFSFISLFLFMAIPALDPAIFQRISMSKNTKQISKAFIIASIICLLITFMISWISILMLADEPGLNAQDIVKHLLSDYSYPGLRGFILAGIMAMLMSTADSYINSTSVLFVHDFCKSLKISVKDELYFSRISSLVIGISAIILAMREGSLLKLLLSASTFYMPIVTMPFIMSIFGFRSSKKAVLIGMFNGFVTVILWEMFFTTEALNSLLPGMIANLASLIGSHYLLKQQGGWVGIKDPAPLIAIRLERKQRWQKLMRDMKEFNLIKICQKNCPKNDSLYSILGFFVMISAFSSTHTLAKEYELIKFLYPVTFCSSAALISYPLWLQHWKGGNIEGIIWNVIMFFVLICFSFLMVLVSDFSEIQLMIFMVNLIILSSLVTWRWALFNIILGVTVTSLLYINYINIEASMHLPSSEFKIVYLLLIVTSTLVIFLRPKQEYQALTEKKNEHLTGRIGFQEKQLREALALKGEFIRNISHEYHAPMTGITTMAEILSESYDQLNDQQRRMAIDTILHSSRRLDIFDANISSLAALSKSGYILNLKPLNLSKFLHERIEICRKIYEENKDDREFILDIDEEIILKLDANYFTQAVDNLLINAMTYCSKGKISISLKTGSQHVICVIEDEGLGIPISELSNIFEEFTVSSKTRTSSGGRGIGLTLCKRVMEVHGGSINAESDGVKGAKFTFIINNE